MGSRRLAGLHQGLDPLERLRAVVQAEGRGDRTHAQQLVASAPWVQVSAQDPAFRDALDQCTRLVAWLAMSTARELGWLGCLEAFQGPVDQATRLAAALPPPEEGDVPMLIIFGLARDGALVRLKALLTAYEERCRQELGVDPDLLLQGFYPLLVEELSPHREDMQRLEVPQEVLEEARAAIGVIRPPRGAR